MKLHHTGLSVPDLDRALAWYCGALGLQPGFRFEVPSAGLRGAFAVSPDGAAVELLEQAGSEPGPSRTDPPTANARHGFNHACFQVEDLDAAYARAVGHGGVAVWDPRESPEPGMRMAYLTDPDGNLIELIAPSGPSGPAGPVTP